GLTGERRRALRLRNTGRHGAVLRHSTAGGTESVREGRATPVGRLTLRRRRACVGHAVLLCRRPRRDGPVRVSGVAWVVGLALRFCVACMPWAALRGRRSRWDGTARRHGAARVAALALWRGRACVSRAVLRCGGACGCGAARVSRRALAEWSVPARHADVRGDRSADRRSVV